MPLQAMRGGTKNLSPLPKGLSPFEKSMSKSLDIQGTFRKVATTALDRALRDGVLQLELEFPPLAGGDQSKSQFDDFDNLSELDANRDWCAQLSPTLQSTLSKMSSFQDVIWFILPDDKECELAKNEWTGQRYRSSCRFTSIRATLASVLGNDEDDQITKAWGSTFASTMNKLFQGGDGILADSSSLDELNPSISPRVHLVCQPGNGGPVEDWINIETLHKVSNTESSTSSSIVAATVVVNGALDKVRDGYYPGIFFPALAATQPFYKAFEAVFWLKPISDKALYGWLYRVYPEPWQVILQTASQQQQEARGGRDEPRMVVQDTIALVSEQRPSYQQAVNAMVQAAAA